MAAYLDVTRAWAVLPATATGTAALRTPGYFLVEQFGQFDPVTPEDTSREVREMARSAGAWMQDFLAEQVDVPGLGLLTRDAAIEANAEGDFRHVRAVVKAMGGDIGLLALNFPEKDGGLEVSLVDKSAISAAVAANGSGSVSVTAGGHTGIGLAPILNSGTEAQQAKYLSDMLSGKKISAFALTEPGAGTDIDAMRTTATLVDLPGGGKGWKLNGTKQFITNASLVFDPKQPGQLIVFAKVDGAITAFIVEGTVAGVSVREEHKMGLKGSSTGQLHFDNVIIPEDALLGKVGQGKEIALNTLGKGRWSIGIGNAGVMHAVVQDAVAYAEERHSMGHPIADYGTIEQMIAEAAVAAYELETMGFGVAGLFEGWLAHLCESNPGTTEAQVWNAVALESSAMKVVGSEQAFRAMVTALQVWGGYGYIDDYPMARRVRDHLVDMIFEGANAIQRAGILVKQFMKRVMQNQIPMPVSNNDTWQAREAYLAETFPNHPLLAAMRMAEASKETVNLAVMALMTIPDAMNVMKDNSRGQHLALALADLLIGAVTNHYVVARALKLVERRGAEAAAVAVQLAMASVYKRDEEVRATARRLVNAVYHGREAERQAALQRLDSLDTRPDVDLLAHQAAIAQHMRRRGGYSVV